jgi:hypothetical protein
MRSPVEEEQIQRRYSFAAGIVEKSIFTGLVTFLSVG